MTLFKVTPGLLSVLTFTPSSKVKFKDGAERVRRLAGRMHQSLTEYKQRYVCQLPSQDNTFRQAVMTG